MPYTRLLTSISALALALGLATSASALGTTEGSVTGGAAAYTSVLTGCQYRSSAPTLTNNQQVALQCDVNGKLITSGAGGGGSNVTVVGPLGQLTKAASVSVALPSDPDYRPSSGTITSQDSGTGTVAGQSSVTLVTGSPTANSFQTWALNGQSSGTLTITGTFVATLKIETSADGGTTYGPSSGKLLGAALSTGTVTAPGIFRVDVTGMTNVRVRASAYTSGTATVQLTASNAPGLTQVVNPIREVDNLGTDITDSTLHVMKSQESNFPVTVDTSTGAAGASTLRVALSAADATNLSSIVTNTGAATPAGGNVIGGVTGSGTFTVAGVAASGASVSGNPVLQGGRAATTTPTAVTDGQAVSQMMTVGGKQVVVVGAIPENLTSGVTAAMTSTTTTSLLAAPAAGLRNYVTNISCSNSHATVGTFVNVQDGSGGTTIATLAAGITYGGEDRSFGGVPLKQPTTATALFVADVTTGANVICSATGYQAP